MNLSRQDLLAWAGYALLLMCGIAGFLVIRGWGETLTAPAATIAAETVSPRGATSHTGTMFHVLLALAAVIATGRILARLFAYIEQPPVIGEVVAGILLGPSLLGRVVPQISEYLLPGSVAPYLSVVAQLGVILYMFQVGLELNADLLRSRARATVTISHVSIVVPFLLGSALSLLLYPRLSHAGDSFTAFALFLGVAMSITAFPVLARILTDRGMSRTPLGTVALTVAATDDVTAWCLLALVVGVAEKQVHSALQVIGLTLAYIGFMLLVVRPLLARRLGSSGAAVSRNVVTFVLLSLLASSLITEAIGVHAIFGAFLLGAVIPHDSAVARTLNRSLEDLVAVLLLPAFFAVTGMRTQIGLVTGWENWLLCGLIILVATAGKFGGTLAAARVTGLSWRDSAVLGALMNTRGLMELIVLNIGLDLGVISPVLFAMMVLMALVTTFSTAPALRWLGETGHKP